MLNKSYEWNTEYESHHIKVTCWYDLREEQRTFQSAQMEGRQPVEVGVLFLKWKKGGYSS
jgi:hypothetical protein